MALCVVNVITLVTCAQIGRTAYDSHFTSKFPCKEELARVRCLRGTALALDGINKDDSDAFYGWETAMVANVLMLSLFYVVLVVPVLWALRPARVVSAI